MGGYDELEFSTGMMRMTQLLARSVFGAIIVVGMWMPGWSATGAEGAAPFGAGAAGGLGFGAGSGGSTTAVSVAGHFTKGQKGKPGELFLTGKIRPGWHIYSITQERGGPLRTKIRLKPSADYRVTAEFQASPPPHKGTQPEAFGSVVVETHEGTVTWHAPIEIASGVDPAKLKIQGVVNAQSCDAKSCYPPEDYPFEVALGEGVPVAAAAGSVSEAGSESAAPTATFNAEELKKNIEQQGDNSSILWILVQGFLGGLILNIMPCVLPVIGLKVLSFVEQSGHDRRTAFLLNVWYALGLLTVFWVLAVLAVTAKLGWGQLFQYPAFNVVMVALVFTMALSFLGVWEFPIPGFVGGSTAMGLAEKEGFSGAFSKGMVTTLLATPCTGPFLGTALTLLLRQSPTTIFATFTSMGLGMASPYLLIGAFPGLVRFLPKPGAWMDTFKQVMGFILLGTVVYLFTFLETSYLVPTLGMLFALWFACWWVARTPITAAAGARQRAWLEAAAMAGVAWLLLFPGLDDVLPEGLEKIRFRGLHEIMAGRLQQRVDHEVGLRIAESQRSDPGSPSDRSGHPKVATGKEHELPWQPFTTRADFEKLLASGKTVLIDFTADWCATCKTLEAWYMNTREVRELVEANGVVTLKADWTTQSPEVTAMLELLGAKQVPVIAIFPAGNPNQPIRFLDGYTKSSILEALRKAGPSKGATSPAMARE